MNLCGLAPLRENYAEVRRGFAETHGEKPDMNFTNYH